jgi:hypothetical protein
LPLSLFAFPAFLFPRRSRYAFSPRDKKKKNLTIPTTLLYNMLKKEIPIFFSEWLAVEPPTANISKTNRR